MVVICLSCLIAALTLLHHPHTVRAQSSPLQIATFSVSPDQTLTYPHAAPAPYLEFFPDEHMTFIPPSSASAPYLIFGSSAVAGQANGEGVVLQSTDLQTFNFATALGYSLVVVTTPVPFDSCNPTYDTEFDENYAGPGSVLQDPTLPPGNLIMIMETENHCPGGVYQMDYYATTSFMRSSDNGKTWPPPVNSPTGNASRYPVLQPSTPPPTTAHTAIGDATASAYIDKSLDGNYYLYAVYTNNGPGADDRIHVARGPLGQSTFRMMKWYNSSFSQPGIGGMETGPGSACPGGGYQNHAQISYNDDLGQYLMTVVCVANTAASPVAAWYYSTATSLDIQDWTPLQLIANSQFPLTTCSTGLFMFDGWYPSFVSPGTTGGHTKSTGSVFLLNGCEVGTRTFNSRTFTITTKPQPAPVLAAGTLANGATYVSGGLVPGSWAQVKGTGLANVTRIWTSFDFLNLGNNLPTSLSGVQVMVNNLPAPVYYISPTQVDFQVPTGVSGNVSVQVINNGTASNILTAPAAASAPGLFPNTVNGVNYPAALYAVSGGYVGPDTMAGYRGAQPGNFIELYATGLVSAPAGFIPTAQAISGVTVTLGGVTVPADYAGQTPYVGEFQINFTVPQQFASMPAGNYPITISVNGVSSPATINSSPPGPIVIPVTP